MWQMRYVYYVSWSQSLYICGKCAMSTMSHGPSLYTYVANALCLLCLIVPVSISVTYVDIHCKCTVSTMSHCPSLYLCLSMWAYICIYINYKKYYVYYIYYAAQIASWNAAGVEPVHRKPADINPGSLK